MPVLEQQVAEIDCEANVLLGKCGSDILINRELGAEADGIVAKDSQCRRPEENLVSLSVRHSSIGLQKSVGTFSNQFPKNSPVPFIGWPAPFGRTVAVDQTVVENARSPVAVMLVELRVRSAQPEVVASRSHAADQTEHCAGNVWSMCDSLEPGLRARDCETCETRGFYSRAHLCGPVLESPRGGGVKIVTRLDSGRRQRRVPNDGRQS